MLEDVHEVTVDHVVEAVYMMYGDAGKIGRVSATDALRACMRLTPGRIIMTELRDDAAWDYLKALNTGHPAVLCQRTLTLRAMPLTVLGCLSRRPLSAVCSI
ncbi:ATPase, T2SS/T4P/T4SS family [Shigella flexneri]|uniref:ATPase, T2SS/T4P/T4SS family n=1 Tax=Shigella flexneri TaxID=623 RepID=UPI003F53EBBB